MKQIFKLPELPATSNRKAPVSNSETVRIISYNIHKGIGGVDRRYRPERIIETLKQYSADIIFLQEVDDQVPRSRMDVQVDLFSEALEMKYSAYQRNVYLKQGYYGNAILSRFPLLDVEDVDLTIPLKKRRQGLLAHCRVKFNGHQRTMLLVNVHLGLAGFERKMQLRKLLEHKTVHRAHKETPVVIGGDLNDVWENLGKQLMTPAGFSVAAKAIRTFPAAFPARALDNLFYRGDLAVSHAFASKSKLAGQASDHRPLVVDFELGVTKAA